MSSSREEKVFDLQTMTMHVSREEKVFQEMFLEEDKNNFLMVQI